MIKTDEEILQIVKECCEKGEMPECVGQISVEFVDPQTIGNKKSGTYKHNSIFQIQLNRKRWLNLSDSEKIYIIKKESCFILASIRMGKPIKPDGEEWRYFAFLTDTIKAKSENDPDDVTVFLASGEW